MLLVVQQSLCVFLSSSVVVAPIAYSPTVFVYCHHSNHLGNCQMMQNDVFLSSLRSLHLSITIETIEHTCYMESFCKYEITCTVNLFLKRNK